MKVYLIVNLSRSPFGLLWTGWDQSFLSKEKAQEKCDELNRINPPNWQLFETELDKENKDTQPCFRRTKMKTARIKYDEWQSEMIRRYPKRDNITFICPVCGYPQTVKQCEEAGLAPGEIGFSCIGRHIEGSMSAFGGNKKNKKTGPCNYAGGGLFALNPVTVVLEDGSGVDVFDVSIEPFCDDPKFSTTKDKVE